MSMRRFFKIQISIAYDRNLIRLHLHVGGPQGGESLMPLPV